MNFGKAKRRKRRRTSVGETRRRRNNRIPANLTTVRMILLARFDIPHGSFFMKSMVQKVLPACGNYSIVFLLKTLVKPMT